MKKYFAFITVCFALLLHVKISYAVSYSGNGGTGFGGAVGDGSLNLVNTGNALSVTLNRGTGALNDWLVIYIDSVAGGVPDTVSLLPDDSDQIKKVVTAAGSGAVIFPAAFQADYALAFNATSGGHLFKFVSGVAIYQLSVGGNGASTNSNFSFTFQLTDIGVFEGSSFSFIGTYLAGNGYRSNEGYGFPGTSANPAVDNLLISSSYYFEPVYDNDSDGVINKFDNCPDVPNSDQLNNDNDSFGDVCDPDDDNDGVVDGNDNCQFIQNPAQKDSDGDGFGNVCDNCPCVFNDNQVDVCGDRYFTYDKDKDCDVDGVDLYDLSIFDSGSIYSFSTEYGSVGSP